MDSNGENQYVPFSYFRNVAGFAIAPTLLRGNARTDACHRSHASAWERKNGRFASHETIEINRKGSDGFSRMKVEGTRDSGERIKTHEGILNHVMGQGTRPVARRAI